MLTESVGIKSERPEIRLGELPKEDVAASVLWMIRSLPDYISDDLKDKLARTKCENLKIVVTPNEIEADSIVVDIPEGIKPEDENAYVTGMGFLDELATETLNRESVKIYPEETKYMEIFKRVFNLPLDEKTIGLISNMHEALFSHDLTNLNDYVQENFESDDFHQFALKIGKSVISSRKKIGASYTAGGFSSSEGTILLGTDFVENRIGSAVLSVLFLGAGFFIQKTLNNFGALFPNEILQMLPQGIFAILGLSVAITNIPGSRDDYVHKLGHEIIHWLAFDSDLKYQGFIKFKQVVNAKS